MRAAGRAGGRRDGGGGERACGRDREVCRRPRSAPGDHDLIRPGLPPTGVRTRPRLPAAAERPQRARSVESPAGVSGLATPPHVLPQDKKVSCRSGALTQLPGLDAVRGEEGHGRERKEGMGGAEVA